MQGTALLASFPGSHTARPPAAAPTVPAAPVFLPKEHGSWSLALEPLALGLLIAPSYAGGALTVAVLAGFFARRPWKALRDPGAARQRAARETMALFSTLGVAAFFLVLVLGGFAPLWPLLLAAPLAGLFAWFDAQNGSRAAAAEVAGSAAFALVPASLATLAGWPAGPALTLAVVALTRSVPTVLLVRTSLRRAKDGRGGFLLPVLTAAGAAAVLTALSVRLLLPPWAALPAWGLLARTLWFAGPLRPAWPARRHGILEALLGVIYVGALITAYRG